MTPRATAGTSRATTFPNSSTRVFHLDTCGVQGSLAEHIGEVAGVVTTRVGSNKTNGVPVSQHPDRKQQRATRETRVNAVAF
jgi:hypothetical protein